jgi:alanyl-tRNA synthetase
MSSLNSIRQTFLDFFAERSHEAVSSASLVPHNDPTLMFTNAGMVPFKNVFTGAETRAYSRAVTAQKVVRAGGKHNDLDNVGYTARHHTFFEMLGNFSFGDYFKEQAIVYAWELMTKIYGISPEKLLVTVYVDDDEAFGLWKKVAGFHDDRIIRISGSDNFWSMGDTGPCGPCTEIFYDHGDHIAGGPPGSPDQDGDRFIEIWNLVFMQFDQQEGGERISLPKPSIDTGMGLERIAAVMQGVHDNYDIDLFKDLIAHSVTLTGVAAEGEARASHRVLADHLRSCSFLIADGVSPSNEGRGYVLRRIMRRAMRHAYLLGSNAPLMPRLVPALIETMGGHYGELRRAEAVITETLRQEEERFRKTLGRGMGLLDEATSGLADGAVLSGDVAFKLYDTYGFPLDLTQDALRARSIEVDTDGFEAAMQSQRERAREHWAGSGDQASQTIWFSLSQSLPTPIFVGYEHLNTQAHVQVMLKDGEVVSQAVAGDRVDILFDKTSFYAESGGQAADLGVIMAAHGHGTVVDVQKQAGEYHVHTVEITEGTFSIGDRAELKVDPLKRAATMRNHSAAHLLHAALKNVLGAHVAQKGQMVDYERLRFDFSHGQSLTMDEWSQIESDVNAVIAQNQPSHTETMSPEKAIEAGAVALFGEKYGDEVRVLTLGQALKAEGAYSVELCGGTHVARIGDIGLFVILSEGGVAAGIRRIEALTGESARLYLMAQARVARSLADQFKLGVPHLEERVVALIAEKKSLEKDLSETKRALAMGGGGGASGPEMINGTTFMGRDMEGVGGKDLRIMAEDLKKQNQDAIIALVATSEGKVAVAVAVPADLVSRFHAAELTKAAVLAMGGQGAGGRPDFAQGGVADDSKASEGLKAIRALIEKA